MQKLNQVVAVERGIKARTTASVTTLYHAVQKPQLFNGFTRAYQKLNEDGENLPSENQIVQYKVKEVLRAIAKHLTESLDIRATLDWANCNARADIIVRGEKLLENVPTTYLMWVEKRLEELHAVIGALPTLDLADTWTEDKNQNVYKAAVVRTAKTKKVKKVLTLAPPTEKHPAQAQSYDDDIIVGHWEQIKISGAIPEPERQRLTERVETLMKAVKHAREQANMTEAPDQQVGEKLLGWLFG